MAVTIDGTTGITTPAISSTTPAGVASGGTGATTLTANNVILGNGTSQVQLVAPGSSGNVLTSNGTTWQSSVLSSGLTLDATLTPAAASSAVSITGLASRKSFFIINNGAASNATATLRFALSDDNGSSYSSPIGFGPTNSTQPNAVFQIFLTNVSASKPYYSLGSGPTIGGGIISTNSGVTNAIQISLSTSTFTGAGSILIYGMN